MLLFCRISPQMTNRIPHIMSIFYREEPPNPSKRCKCLALAIRDVFSYCHSLRGKIIKSSPESKEKVSDFDEEEEIFVSAVISKYIESKSKRKSSVGIDNCYWALSPAKEDSITTSKPVENEEFLSVSSRLSRCSSATTFDEFVSAKSTCFSRCSSLKRIEFQHFGKRRSIIMEFINCEGWPFGLCRKALLLPPLPKSPTDSWSWRKSGRMVRIYE